METLVLSAGYEPVARVSWKRAVCLLFDGKVEVIEEYQDKWVRSVTIELKMPSVVRFFKAVRARKQTPKFSRENVFQRDGGRCQYCGCKMARPQATYDHVLPRALGGKTNWENIVIACLPCNQKKGARTPEQAGFTLRQKPVRPKKLSVALRFTFSTPRGVPHSWQNWLRDLAYWNGELEQDE